MRSNRSIKHKYIFEFARLDILAYTGIAYTKSLPGDESYINFFLKEVPPFGEKYFLAYSGPKIRQKEN